MTYYTSQYLQTDNQHLQMVSPNEGLLDSRVELSLDRIFCEICQIKNNKCLLTCSICFISVHNDCYCVEEEIGLWKCEKCTYLLDHNEEIECIICRKSFGGLKKSEKGWIHPLCQNWPSYENLLGDECCVCKDTVGNIIACGVCWKSFHPYCGAMNGLKFINWSVSCSDHTNEIIDLSKNSKKERASRKSGKRGRRKIKKIYTEDKENRDLVVCYDKGKQNENESVSLSKEISKIMKIRKRGPAKEILKLFEDYLFLNSTVTSESYVLNLPLSNAFGLREVSFNDVSKIFFRCCNN